MYSVTNTIDLIWAGVNSLVNNPVQHLTRYLALFQGTKEILNTDSSSESQLLTRRISPFCHADNLELSDSVCKAKEAEMYIFGDYSYKQSDKFICKIEPEQLDESLCETARPYIDSETALLSLPKASYGHIDVRLQDSTVIKETGDLEAKKEMHKAEFARNLLVKHGLDIEIPTSCIYKGRSIKKRYLGSLSVADSFLAYYQNSCAFTKRAEDFTKLLMHTYLADIVTSERNLEDLIELSPAARYDNVALLPTGKIVLLDLDQLYIGQTEDPIRACAKAITFFPYHFEPILKITEKFLPDIESHRYRLELYRDRVLNRLTLYTKHWDFLNNNHITYKNIDFTKPFTYTIEQEKDLEKAIRKNLKTNFPYGHIDLSPLFGADRFLIPIIESIEKTLHEELLKQIDREKVHPKMSLIDISEQRTVLLNWEHGNIVKKKLYEKPQNPTKNFHMGYQVGYQDFTTYFSEKVLVHEIMKDLEKKGYIADYSDFLYRVRM